MGNIKNKFVFINSFVFMFISLMFMPIKALENKEHYKVTDRDLLALSIMSYSDYPLEHNENCTVDKMWAEQFAGVVMKKWYGKKDMITGMEDWVVVDYEINEELSEKCGFSVITFKKENNIVIAFRGTDQGLFSENWKYLIPYMEHPQSTYVPKYIDKLEKSGVFDGDTNIYITGHSLGGYLSLYATGVILQKDELKEKFVRTATFNGLGIGFTDSYYIRENLSKLTDEQLVNYRISGDAVSMIGKHFTNVVTLDFTYIEPSWGTMYSWTKAPHLLTQFFFTKCFNT